MVVLILCWQNLTIESFHITYELDDGQREDMLKPMAAYFLGARMLSDLISVSCDRGTLTGDCGSVHAAV